MEKRNDKGKEIVKVEDSKNLVLLPQDMRGEVMERLPLKSIARLRSVSKSWLKDIDGEDFMRRFMARSVEKHLFLFSSVESSTQLGTYSRWFHSVLQDTLPKPLNQHQVDLPTLMTDSSYYMCEPVLGLVCCYNGLQNVMICNPAVATFIELPRITSSNTDCMLKQCFLGFDQDNKLFKVLCMVKIIKALGVYDRKFHIFTLGVGQKNWRPISCPFPHEPLPNGIYINGVIYYPAEERETGNRNRFVMGFNVQSETYAVINVTMEISSLFKVERFNKRTLMNYNNQLAIARDCGMSFHIWILDGQKSVWSKHCTTIKPSEVKDYYCMGSIGPNILLFAPKFVSKGQVHVLLYQRYPEEGKEETMEKLEIEIKTSSDRGNSFLDAYLNHVESPLLNLH